MMIKQQLDQNVLYIDLLLATMTGPLTSDLPVQLPSDEAVHLAMLAERAQAMYQFTIASPGRPRLQQLALAASEKIIAQIEARAGSMGITAEKLEQMTTQTAITAVRNRGAR